MLHCGHVARTVWFTGHTTYCASGPHGCNVIPQTDSTASLPSLPQSGPRPVTSVVPADIRIEEHFGATEYLQKAASAAHRLRGGMRPDPRGTECGAECTAGPVGAGWRDQHAARDQHGGTEVRHERPGHPADGQLEHAGEHRRPRAAAPAEGEELALGRDRVGSGADRRGRRVCQPRFVAASGTVGLRLSAGHRRQRARGHNPWFARAGDCHDPR